MAFDPASFLDMAVTGANDTKLVPIPIGEYVGTTGDVEVKTWQSKDDSSKSGLKLEIQIAIDDAKAREVTGRDKLTVKHDVMLDTLPGGGLDMGKGKNVGLGRLREATGLNDANQPFSFRMLSGRPLKVAIKHREYKGDMFAEVSGVAKL